MLDLDTAYRWISWVLAAGQCVAGAEMIHLHASGTMERVLPWRIAAMRSPRAQRRAALAPLADRLYSRAGSVAQGAVRIVGGVALAGAAPFTAPFTSALAVLALGLVVDQYRNVLGGEGADQMSLLLTVALLVGGIPGASPFVRDAALVFVALQSVLSYVVAGVAKVVSPVWRSGRAIVGVLSTAGYGFPALARTVAGVPGAARAASWSVMLFEMGFVLVLLDVRLAVAFVLAGLLFHLVNALVMGLNAFLLAFPAAYPAVLWVAARS